MSLDLIGLCTLALIMVVYVIWDFLDVISKDMERKEEHDKLSKRR